ncbi:hypothetical protein NB716_004557 [Pantoea ananatis]|nr:hypothetical protein [Pantoea ananatis]
MLKGPLIERAAGKFRALIGSYCRRIAPKQRDAVQNTRDLNAGNTESSGDRQTLLREIIHTGQALDPATVGQCVHNEIHRPCKVRRIRAKKRKPFGRQPFTASSAFYAQSIKVVDTVYPLVIDVKALPTQQLPDTPVTKTSAFKRQLSNTP